jgi:hypothetical protein
MSANTCAFGISEEDLIWTRAVGGCPKWRSASYNLSSVLDQRVTNVMGLNTKSPGVRRILEEAKEIQADPSVDFVAAPSEVSILKTVANN